MLADGLTRSWTALYPVIGQLRAAAGLVGPDPSLPARLAVPLQPSSSVTTTRSTGRGRPAVGRPLQPPCRPP